MPGNDNVTALLYRRRTGADTKESRIEYEIRPMAFDPLLVFTGVLVAGAAVSQLLFLLIMEF